MKAFSKIEVRCESDVNTFFYVHYVDGTKVEYESIDSSWPNEIQTGTRVSEEFGLFLTDEVAPYYICENKILEFDYLPNGTRNITKEEEL